MKRLRFFFAIGLLLPPFSLLGCGGGSGPGGQQLAGGAVGREAGRATITVNWPALSKSVSRLIPAASNSVVVRIEDNGTTVGTATVVRPSGGSIQSDCTFDSLPVKTLTVVSTAYPNADGTGTAQARVSSPLTITSGKTTALSLTLDSTIVRIDVAGPNGELAVPLNGSLMLTATPRDATGAVVLTTPGNMHLACSDSSIANIDQSGTITGNKLGTVTITATETEHNIVSTTEFNVGRLYIAGITSRFVTRIDNMNGANKVTYDTGLTGPFGVYIRHNDNSIYISDYDGNKVVRMDDWSGTNKVTYSTGLSMPAGIFVSDSNHIYIADYGNNRIVRMDDMTGTNLVAYSTNIKRPGDIYVDGSERIYITSQIGNVITRIDDMNGTNRVDYTTGVNTSLGIFVDAAGRIYFTNQSTGTLVRMDDMSGTNKVTYSTDLNSPASIWVTNNRIFVTETSGRIIRIDNMNGDNRVNYNSRLIFAYGLLLR